MKKKIGIIIVLLIGCLFGFFVIYTQEDIYRQKQAVTELTSLSNELCPDIKSLGNGLIVTCRNEYIEKDDSISSYFDVIDLMKDDILYSIKLDQYYDIHSVQKDSIVIRDTDHNALDFYNFQLEKIKSLNVIDTYGFFIDDHYYYLDQNALYTMNINTNESQLVDIEQNMRLASLTNVYDHYLICNAYLNDEFDETAIAMLDVDTGSFEIINDDYFDLYKNDQLLLLKRYQKNNEKADYIYSFDHQYYTINEAVFKKGLEELCYLPDTTYLFDFGEFSEMERVDEKTVIYQLGQMITTCDLRDYGFSKSLASLTYLKQENLIVGYDGKKLIIVDPTYLKWQDFKECQSIDIELRKQSIIDYYHLDQESKITGLTKAKKKVEQIENQYPIHIVLSTDCLDGKLEQSGYEFKDTHGYKNEETKILKALKILENTLKLYPKGFFEQFYTKAHDGGVYFYLIGEIDSDVGIAAFTFESAYRQKIGIDIQYMSRETICHEMWHAMENVMVAKDGQIFDDWDQLNPKGFEYRMTYDDYAEYDGSYRYTFYGETDINNVYFVDDYARTFDREDRARLVESMLGEDKNFAEMLRDSPHIVKKIQKINEAIEKTFEISINI